jgi:catechol 2,3-dioxygenase-like lactoylglutathione lyase family enzyme
MTSLKAHIALNVTHLERSIAFYQALFGIAPVKHKVDYAKFDLETPALNLTLNQATTVHPHGALSHLGVQVDSTADVQAAIARFKAAGLDLLEEHNTNCCYALQDKVWVQDPDGNRWEIFVVKVGDTTPADNLANRL